tara:strand:+ start:58041 stop:58679 length:639 start_codon:yes stop_codon:yes gene_type:complete
MMRTAESQFGLTAMELSAMDLLPQRFREQRQIHRTAYLWSGLSLLSLALLVGTVAALWAHAKNVESQQTQLLADAAPLQVVRQDVIRMQAEVESLRFACTLAESAKPHDELVQLLAALTLASHDFEDSILIDSVDIHLPLESPTDQSSRPDWAKASMKVTADVDNDRTMAQWLDRLNASDRIHEPMIADNDAEQRQLSRSIEATPIVIGDLP